VLGQEVVVSYAYKQLKQVILPQQGGRPEIKGANGINRLGEMQKHRGVRKARNHGEGRRIKEEWKKQ
jgi:hypothetical protein